MYVCAYMNVLTLRVVQSVGIDKGDIPDLAKVRTALQYQQLL